MYELFILSLRRNRQNPYGTNKHRKKTQGPVYICHLLTTVLSCFCGFYTIKSMETAGFYAVGVLFLCFWGWSVCFKKVQNVLFQILSNSRWNDVSFLPNARMNGNEPFLACMCTHCTELRLFLVLAEPEETYCRLNINGEMCWLKTHGDRGQIKLLQGSQFFQEMQNDSFMHVNKLVKYTISWALLAPLVHINACGKIV